jgi:hypothetical protein
MILGALQAVDVPKTNQDEDLQSKVTMIKAICNKLATSDSETMPVHQQAIMFATISRFIANQPTETMN